MPPKRKRRSQHVPDDSDLIKLAAAADPQLRLCLWLMSDAGCRLSEALAFDVSSLSGNLLRIWSTKSDRWRSVPVTRRLMSAIDDLTTRTPLPLSGIYPRWVQRRINELAAALDIPPTSPHRFRHSYATRLFLEGIPAAVVMHLLGHLNIATTFIYIHVEGADLSVAARALDRRAAAAAAAIESDRNLSGK